MKLVYIAISALIASLSIASASQAASATPVSPAQRCMNMSDSSQIFTCLDSTVRLEDAKLAKANATVTTLLESKEPARLPAAQRAEAAWTAFRDADCAFAKSAFDDGDAATAAEEVCVINHSIQRQADLYKILADLKLHIQQNGE